MAKFDEFVQKTAETAETLADKSAVIAKKAAEGAKSVMRIGKLNVDIAAERDCIRRNYFQLGKRYYDAHKDSPEPGMEQAVADIARAEAKIAALRAEIDGLCAAGRKAEEEYEEAVAEAELEEAKAAEAAADAQPESEKTDGEAEPSGDDAE